MNEPVSARSSGRHARARSRMARQMGEALRMLLRRPLRSILIASGVGVALGALIIAEAVAENGRMQTIREIGRMGANVVIVSAQQSRALGGRGRTGTEVTTLDIRDAGSIAASVPGIASTSVEYRGTAPVKFGALARQASVSGVESTYGSLRSAPMLRGHFFDESDAMSAQRVAVLGAQLAQDLAGSDDPVGEILWVRGIPFRIVGVLPPRGTGVDAFDEDGVVFVPIRTAQRRLFQVSYVQRIFLRIDENITTLGQAAAAIASALAARHHLPNDLIGTQQADFRVETQGRLLDIRSASARRLRAFEIGAAVLLVGAGSGGTLALQNLTVRERLSEVGTRRALGASRGEIFLQFLTEAVVASVLGGTIGSAGGLAVVSLAGWRFPAATGITAFVACVSCCVCAACVPTWRSARLQPAATLRES
jgi:putative ABC transport system permease protein